MNCGKVFIPKSKNQRFCCPDCNVKYKSNKKYDDYLANPDNYSGVRDMKWVKKFVLEEQEHKCAICGMEDNWNEKPIVFILDHIDGHAMLEITVGII